MERILGREGGKEQGREEGKEEGREGGREGGYISMKSKNWMYCIEIKNYVIVIAVKYIERYIRY